jgi:hypothetical protein
MPKRLPAIVGLALTLSPVAALACPACYSSMGSHLLNTYYVSAIFLSLLPFAVVITVVAVARSLRRRFDDLPVQETWSPQG